MSEWGWVDTPDIRFRLAMPWDEWKDKIQRECSGSVWTERGIGVCPSCEGQGGPDCPTTTEPPYWHNANGSMGRYVIRHPDGRHGPTKSRLDYSHYLDKNGKPHLPIHMIQTAYEFQNRGVAEALMRRLNEDYPLISIIPGGMTDDGQAFHDRMLEKEPKARDLVTAQRLAMAWQDHADKIQHHRREDGGGLYYIEHPEWGSSPMVGYPKSYLTYSIQARPKRALIDMIHTNFLNQHDGVAEALMRRLNQDYPDHKIVPGSMSEDGQAFHDRMLQKEPDAKSVLAQRLAMAWQDWKDKITGGCDHCAFEPGEGTWDEKAQVMRYPSPHGRYVIPQAGAFLDYSHGRYMGKPELSVHGIYTHPSNRNDGVAEALMRRLAEDHPGVSINPGVMTNDGKKFHDRMLEKDPEARDLITAANQIIEAMAWQDWADKINHTDQGDGFGRYTISHPEIAPDAWRSNESYLSYDTEQGEAYVNMLYTTPKYRNDGVAEALIRRLHEDHPDLQINPGGMTPDGQAFHKKMLEKEPQARDVVRQANWLL